MGVEWNRNAVRRCTVRELIRLWKERDYHSDRKSLFEFQSALEKGGLNATIRRTLGSDIDAACGQLRREYEL